MKIASRNVNGIRAVIGKGFYDWVKQTNPDIICLQETKSFEHQLPPDFRYHMQGYERIWHSGTTPGYAGTATFYKKHLNILSKRSVFEEREHFHADGRVVETKFAGFTLINVYFPNGGEKADGTEMLTYKLDFYHHMLHYIDQLRAAGEQIIVCGDFNICHRAIDIARPKENEHSIGFLPIERAELDNRESHEYIDVFRHFFPTTKDHYTWWSYRAGARPRNVGWRLDYFWVSQNLIPSISKITHQTMVEGSDHCPILLELEG